MIGSSALGVCLDYWFFVTVYDLQMDAGSFAEYKSGLGNLSASNSTRLLSTSIFD